MEMESKKQLLKEVLSGRKPLRALLQDDRTCLYQLITTIDGVVSHEDLYSGDWDSPLTSVNRISRQEFQEHIECGVFLPVFVAVRDFEFETSNWLAFGRAVGAVNKATEATDTDGALVLPEHAWGLGVS